MNLYQSAMKTLERFYAKGIYNNRVGMGVDLKGRLSISPKGRNSFSELEKIMQEENIKKIIFNGLEPNNKKVKAIVSCRSFYNRIMVELCKKIPFPNLKNKFYQHLGIKVGKGVTIAPNVWFDYLNPNLITIGDGTVVGEEAMILTHFLYPERYEMGLVNIGKKCVIGARAIIYPGVKIGNNAKIGTYAVVHKDVPEGGIVTSLQKFSD